MPLIVDLPLFEVAGHPVGELEEMGDRRTVDGGYGSNPGQGGFANLHPVVEQDRMADEEGGHAQPGGVADTEVAPKLPVEPHRAVR